jgi:hypothetical protein
MPANRARGNRHLGELERDVAALTHNPLALFLTRGS